MASPLPFFEQPAPKKRRPEVPKFSVASLAGKLSAGEYERRMKAGMIDCQGTPTPGIAATPTQTTGAAQVSVAAAAADHAPPDHPLAGAVAESAVPPAPPAESDGAAARTNPKATPRSSDHHASPDASGRMDPEPISESDEQGQGSQGPKVGQRFAGVYGLDARHTLQAREGTRKAIALRLEPLRDGLPSFERVLTEGVQSVTIGSKRNSCDVIVVDEAVSKKHCVLALVGIKGELALSIIDHSTNGTFVNGKRLPTKGKRFRIRSGDTVQVKDLALEEDFGWKCDFGNTVSYFQRA